MKYVLVTGSSTGIGYSAVEHLINRGYSVFGSVRKQDDATRLRSVFGEKFIPLIFDVTDEKAILESVEIVKSKLTSSDELLLLLIIQELR